jgi:hypothetical protein
VVHERADLPQEEHLGLRPHPAPGELGRVLAVLPADPSQGGVEVEVVGVAGDQPGPQLVSLPCDENPLLQNAGVIPGRETVLLVAGVGTRGHGDQVVHDDFPVEERGMSGHRHVGWGLSSALTSPARTEGTDSSSG